MFILYFVECLFRQQISSAVCASVRILDHTKLSSEDFEVKVKSGHCTRQGGSSFKSSDCFIASKWNAKEVLSEVLAETLDRARVVFHYVTFIFDKQPGASSRDLLLTGSRRSGQNCT